MNDLLATLSSILGIIISCITIYQALVKKKPANSPPPQPTFSDPYPQNLYPEVPWPQPYPPKQTRKRIFSWKRGAGTFIGMFCGLFLLILVPAEVRKIQGLITYSVDIRVLIWLLPLCLIIGIVAGFVRARR